MNCKYCGSLPNKNPNLYKCPKCGMLNIPNTNDEGDPEVVRLSATIGPPVPRINVGIYNDLFGDGLAVSSVNMIAGPPGAGKTTLFLMLLEMILTELPEGDGLYIANEQSRAELQDYAVRLGVTKFERILYYNAMGGLRRPLQSIFQDYKPKFTILDSLTNLVGEELQLAVEVIKQFKEYSVTAQAPAMVINQVTKDGNHAGLMKVLHQGDSVLHLELDEVTKKRLLYSSKNRFGPAPVEVGLLMNENNGQLYLDPEFENEE